MNALQAPAVGVQAAPLVSSLLQLGAAATRRTEAVAAVPGQHRPSLSHNSWWTKRENKDDSGSLFLEYQDQRRKEYCIFLTGLFLVEFQQVSVGRLWEGAVLFSGAFEKFSSVFVCAEGKPGRRLLDSIVCLRGGGGGGFFPLLHSEEDEHSRRFLEKVFNGLISEPTELGLTLLELESQSLEKNDVKNVKT